MIPTWMQIIIGAALFVTALGTLWKVILPGAKLIAEGSQMLPVLRDLLKQFGEAPGALSVLKEVAAQFRTDSGSSLRDQVNRLEAASQRIEGRAKTLELRDEEDRTRAARLAAALDALAATVGNMRGAPVSPTVPSTALSAPAPAEPGVSAPVVATDVHISGVGVGDKLLVQVEDIQPKETL